MAYQLETASSAATDAELRSTSARAAQVAVAWAAAEGWNPGLDDGHRFLAADPEAFLATERAGEIVASVSCALYGRAYAFIGFYIVRADLRGHGIGLPLFERALMRAGPRVVGLDAVLAQEATYARCGFITSHRNVRWRMIGGGQCPRGFVELRSLPFGMYCNGSPPEDVDRVFGVTTLEFG